MVWILAAVVVVFLIAVFIYNNLISCKNRVSDAFSSIDVMLTKRYDLIPNLVEAVRNYMQHEKSVLNTLTELRAQATSRQLSNDEKVAINNKISQALNGLMVAVENYPNLKASDNFLMLQRSLNEVEEQLSASRRSFNAAVTAYNNAIEMFPSNFFASALNFGRKEWFEAVDKKKENVQVGKLFDNK